MAMIFFHKINPILFTIGPLKIGYYGLAYAFGILIAIKYIKKINSNINVIAEEKIDDFIIYAIIGIIIGGRMGYVLFYNFEFYINNPINIFKTWEGGMSFHGGLLGSIISIFLFSKKHNISFLKFCDLIVPSVPIGLFLGRIANFINGELIGKPTDGTWGVIFPNGGNIPRHPSQIYEAILEGLFLFFILNFILNKSYNAKRNGLLSGAFLLFYGLFRIIIEVFREPDIQLGTIAANLSMGQILSIPMILIGSLIIKHSIIDKKHD